MCLHITKLQYNSPLWLHIPIQIPYPTLQAPPYDLKDKGSGAALLLSTLNGSRGWLEQSIAKTGPAQDSWVLIGPS